MATASLDVLSVEGLMQAASDRTGLSDYGDRWFVRPLEALLHFATSEGGLTPQDPRVDMLVRNLSDRLKLNELIRLNPELLDEELRVGGVMIGQARGGSTLMQRLMVNSPPDHLALFLGDDGAAAAARRGAGGP